MRVRLFNHYFSVISLLLAVVDAFVIFASVYLAVGFCDYGGICGATYHHVSLLQASVVLAVMIVSMAAMGLYQLDSVGYLSVIIRIAVGFVVGGIALLLASEISLIQLSKIALLLMIVMAFLAICLLRVLYIHTACGRFLKRRILIYGAGHKADTLLARMRHKIDQHCFVIVGFVHTIGDPDNSRPGKRVLQLGSTSLCDYAKLLDVDEIVDAVDDQRSNVSPITSLDCKAHGIDVIDLLSFFEREFCNINVSLLTPGWVALFNGFRHTQLNSMIKRGLDIVHSLIVLMLTWPLMILAIFATLVESGFKGSVMYSQVRVGKHGKLFRIYKFRSMCVDAEKEGKAVWALENDVRVTRVGKFLRRTRLDELPQIANVLKGDMSLVGPRPERPEFDSMLRKKIDFYDQRNQLKPGITGWAQLCYPYGASENDALEKLQYDLYYLKNQNLFLDFLIMLRTFEVILFGKGVR